MKIVLVATKLMLMVAIAGVATMPMITRLTDAKHAVTTNNCADAEGDHFNADSHRDQVCEPAQAHQYPVHPANGWARLAHWL